MHVSAHAQSDGANADDSAESQLTEVIVLARKRQESILRVPVIENVLTEEELIQSNITSIERLTTKVPGLLIGRAQVAIGPQISLRGVGATSQDAGVDQPVALNLDGLVLTQSLAYKAGIFDVAQVEVLKGPQALFYGKSSPAGVVALRTADPGKEPEAIARYGYEGEAREHRGELILSSPLTDTLGVRLATMYSDFGGFFHNEATALPGFGGKTPKDRRLGPTESAIVRGTVLWEPSAAFEARLKLNYTRDDTTGDAGNGQLKSCPDGTGSPSGVQFFNPAEDCRFDRTMHVVDLDPAAFPGVRNNGVRFMDMDQKFGTLEMNFHPTAQLTLTSLTGYYRLELDALTNGTLTGYAGPSLYSDNVFDRRQFTQELRLNSEFDTSVNFTVGAFYEDGRISNDITIGGNTALNLPTLLQKGSHRIDIETFSIFGQVRWNPVPAVELSAGARWTDEERSDDAVNSISGVPVPVDLAVPKLSSSNWSPELTVSYTPTDTLTVFGSLKQAYKSGSFTITTVSSNGANNSFRDEKVRGGELGIKARLADRRWALNVAGYYYKYTDLQVGAAEPSTNVPVIRTINAGGAKVYGIDLDTTYRVPNIDSLTLNGSINWNHARFTELDNVPCWGGQTIAEGCDGLIDPRTGLHVTQDLKGARLVRAPDWQAAGGINYETLVTNRLRIGLGASGRYTSKYATTLHDRSDLFMKGFFIFDANVSVGDSDDKWELALIGNNLANKLTYGTCQPFNFANGTILGGQVTGGTTRGPAGIDEVQCVGQRGREVWLRLTFKPLNWTK